MVLLNSNTREKAALFSRNDSFCTLIFGFGSTRVYSRNFRKERMKQLIIDTSYQKALLLKEMKRYHDALETLDDLLQLDLENVKALAIRADLLMLLQKQ